MPYLLIRILILVCVLGISPVFSAENIPSATATSPINIAHLNQKIAQSQTTNFPKSSFLPKYKESNSQQQPNLKISVLGVFLQLIVVLGIIYLIVLLVRYFLNNKSSQNTSNKIVKVIESHYLTPKQALHIVEIGSKIFILGASDHAFSNLSEITDSETKEFILTQTYAKEKKFSKYLKYFLKEDSETQTDLDMV